jgi:hypothetical protein
MKPRYNNTPLSYIELYPVALEHKRPPSAFAEAVCALLLACCALVLTIVLFSL